MTNPLVLMPLLGLHGELKPEKHAAAISPSTIGNVAGAAGGAAQPANKHIQPASTRHAAALLTLMFRDTHNNYILPTARTLNTLPMGVSTTPHMVQDDIGNADPAAERRDPSSADADSAQQNTSSARAVSALRNRADSI